MRQGAICIERERDILAFRVHELERCVDAQAQGARMTSPKMSELASQVEQWKAYAKRLEEAGGELDGRIGCTGCDDFTCLRCDEASAKWQQAKETKP
jgi:hypothetical protein